MNRLELWLLRRLLRKHIVTNTWNGDHMHATGGIFQMVREVWHEVSYEDNAATISSCLSECFEATQVWPHGRPAAQEKQP